LKHSLDTDADNLLYEYYVGKYINKQITRFSCFIETYGVFVNKIDNIKNIIQTKDLQTHLQNISEHNNQYQISCKYSNRLSILIQHINTKKTLGDMIQNKQFNQTELLYVLFQIYMPLMCLQEEFTHYDLHMNNVLVYEPINDQYIEYHYIIDNNTTIRFKSKYLVKIIDYGRCFFKYDKSDNSEKILEKICKEKYCNFKKERTVTEKCGNYSGYTFLNNKKFDENDFHIVSTKCNQSHDLQLFTNLKDYNGLPNELINIISRVVYCVGNDKIELKENFLVFTIKDKNYTIDKNFFIKIQKKNIITINNTTYLNLSSISKELPLYIDLKSINIINNNTQIYNIVYIDSINKQELYKIIENDYRNGTYPNPTKPNK
jgi:hypothetical protein